MLILLKSQIIKYLHEKGIECINFGTNDNESVDYVEYAVKLCTAINKKQVDLGILICGTGIGMSIAANKVKGIRAIRAVDELDCYNGKNHNGANVLCIGSNLDEELIKRMIDTFIDTPNPNEKRHIERINKIIKYENGEYNAL